jgi:Helix-turn-helix domain
MAQHGKMPRLKERAIQALLQHATLKAAAESIGISARTLQRWWADAEFRTAFRQVKADALGGALAKLAGGSGEAVDALLAVIRGRRASAGARVSASVRLLELCLRDREDENLGARIDALEAELNRREGGGH